MNNQKLILTIDKVSDSLLSLIESRDVALWVRSMPENPPPLDRWTSFLSLPWRMVISEIDDPQVLDLLEAQANSDVAMTRKRGFVQIIEGDPSRIDLPQRCLPLFLLNGRSDVETSQHEQLLRRLNMLEELRRSGVPQILVISGLNDHPLPPDLRELWSSGFRAYLTIATDRSDAVDSLTAWLEETAGVVTPNLSSLPAAELVTDLLTRFDASYPEDRHVIRVRNQEGVLRKIDITEVDEPERPILERYELIEDRDLELLVETELSQEQFVGFFRDPSSSWRPYAAGLPWLRDEACKTKLGECLKKLDVGGSQENCIAYVLSEAGAGGTTIARTLAWEFARQGYPVLVARPMPFVPDPLTIGNYLTRAHLVEEEKHRDTSTAIDGSAGVPPLSDQEESRSSRYEVPWIIVFDRLHWEERDSELRRFIKELEKQGRPVCLLVVTGPMRSLSYFDSAVFKQVSELNHTLDQDEARALGRHLNRFLREYGQERPSWQWDRFYDEHTVRYLEGTAAFWVTLSFWIQGQYDLSESIQQWMYRQFKENIQDDMVRKAILEIAALSAERVPLPEGLLPASKTWPISHLLEDERPNLASLGLMRVSANGQKYWALAHDILGRFLVNAFFFDYPMRESHGYSETQSADHLRFLLLREISRKRELGERQFRAVGEDFATSIFKIDPDHGRGSFAYFWRDVLMALDEMPRALRDTSRVFRHHSAVTRRRIAMLDERIYSVTVDDRVQLLNRAIEDINYALTSIDYEPGSESNLNLYNSLANAYLNLAAAEAAAGASRDRVLELRQQADTATRKAYEESPDNSFTIETYVKNRLGNAEVFPERAVEYCIEALGVLFSAIASNEGNYRRTQLGDLADKAMGILLRQMPADLAVVEPRNATDVLLTAWALLSNGVDHDSGIALSEIPEFNRAKALAALEHSAGVGNMQVIRLSYDLTCVHTPLAFARQLELAEQLEATDYRMTPQIRLEYGVLLYQNSRSVEGDRVFRSLRRLWRESECFVQVPERLRWLRVPGSEELRTVQAVSGSDYEHRAMARVREFGDLLVPFRPEEFGFRDLRPGTRFAAHVTFGHNGPFLRPVTAHAKKLH